MKKLVYLLFFVYCSAFAQEKIVISPNGTNPIVVEVQGSNAESLYNKTKNWINTYYKSPKDVLKGDIQNEMIRIEGFAKDGYKMKNLGMVFGYDYFYTLEIQFKDGKYRFEYIIGALWSDGKRCMYDYDDFFKKDGTIKNTYALAHESMTSTINETSSSLYNYLTGKSSELKKDW